MEKEFITKEFEERMTHIFARMHGMCTGSDALMRSAMEAGAMMSVLNAKDLMGFNEESKHSELFEKCRSNASAFLYITAFLADAAGLSLNELARDTVNALEEKRRLEGELVQ